MTSSTNYIQTQSFVHVSRMGEEQQINYEREGGHGKMLKKEEEHNGIPPQTIEVEKKDQQEHADEEDLSEIGVVSITSEDFEDCIQSTDEDTKSIENSDDRVNTETENLLNEREKHLSDLKLSEALQECTILRQALDRAQENYELREKRCKKLEADIEDVKEERNFLLERLENSQKTYDARLDRELKSMKQKINDLINERAELQKKVEIMELYRKSTVETKTIGTQADFTVNILSLDDNQSSRSVISKVSAVTFGESSAGSQATNRTDTSGLSGVTQDTNKTSDTKSIRKHASRVLKLAKRTFGVSSKKKAVSDLFSETNGHPPVPKTINEPEHVHVLPPIPRSPRSPKKKDSPSQSRTSKHSRSSPTTPTEHKSSSQYEAAENDNASQRSSSSRMKEKIFKSSKKSSSSKSNKKGSKPLFSNTPDDLEFYLPKVSLDGSDAATDPSQDENRDRNSTEDPTALQNVFRPWQVEFLKHIRIRTASQLVFATKYKSSNIAKSMVKWRAERNMKHFKAKACGVALHIWTRTIEAKIRSSILERTASTELEYKTMSPIKEQPQYKTTISPTRIT